MDKKHALLSASSSHRWLTCPPLARLEELFENKTSDAAEEGTLAHFIAENKLKQALGLEYESLNAPDKEMDNYTDEYVTYVLEELEKLKQHTKDPLVHIEQRLDFSHYVPEGFGTGDCVLVADKTIHIIDFKYGRGVEVSAVNNPQMKLYALGALRIYEAIYDIEEIAMTIFQPRKYNISTDIISVEELVDWAENELKEKAELAFEGKGTVEYGPWCQFSSCSVVLRARYDHHKKLERFQLQSPHLLTDSEIEEVLSHVDDLSKWAEEVKEYAQKVATQTGKKWNGYKLVEARTNRKFKNEEEVIKLLEDKGYEDIYKKSLVSMTELQKKLGKAKFEELLSKMIYKPKGKAVLVSNTDRRKEIINATNEFNIITEDK